MTLKQAPVAKAEMLIRKPVAEVFEAFINPEVTSKFWFTKSSGKLEAGKQITWTWEMYNVSTQVNVKVIERNKRILIEWSSYGTPTTVEWIFTPYGNDSTFVSITNSGFKGDGDKVVADALGSKGGFTWVLAGLKASLEHNIKLNLITDAFPKAAGTLKDTRGLHRATRAGLVTTQNGPRSLGGERRISPGFLSGLRPLRTAWRSPSFSRCRYSTSTTMLGFTHCGGVSGSS